MVSSCIICRKSCSATPLNSRTPSCVILLRPRTVGFLAAWFGNEEQERCWVRRLERGGWLWGCELTGPCAGSDLTVLRTRAVREGNEFVVTGEKLFITNVPPGRTIGLVCLIDDQPAVLV